MCVFSGDREHCGGTYVRKCCHLLAMQIRRGVEEIHRSSAVLVLAGRLLLVCHLSVVCFAHDPYDHPNSLYHRK